MDTRPSGPGAIRQAIVAAIVQGRADAFDRALSTAAPAEAVRALEGLAPDHLAAAVALLGEQRLAELLEYVAATDAAALVVKLGRAQAADVLELMAPDDAADLVEELPRRQAEAILVAMEPGEAAGLRALLAYPPHSAAGLMTREMVTISPDLTAEEALAAIRRVAREAETIYDVYVTAEDDRLLGVLSLRDIVLAPPARPLGQIARRDVVHVRADADQEVAARALADRGLLAVPVVDEHDRLLGIITADDAVDVLEEEATEDVERLGGSEPLERPYLRTGALTLVWKRVRWLLVLFVAEAYTGSVLRHYEDTLAAAVPLTFFIPLLIGTGGNTGSQVTTTLTRALAVGDVKPRDWPVVLRKELGTSVVLGAVMALVTAARAWTLGVDPLIGTVVATTAASIVVWAAAVAAVMPLVLRRVGLDPADVSAPFITTVVDGTGLVIYLSIANRVLGL